MRANLLVHAFKRRKRKKRPKSPLWCSGNIAVRLNRVRFGVPTSNVRPEQQEISFSCCSGRTLGGPTMDFFSKMWKESLQARRFSLRMCRGEIFKIGLRRGRLAYASLIRARSGSSHISLVPLIQQKGFWWLWHFIQFFPVVFSSPAKFLPCSSSRFWVVAAVCLFSLW